MARGPRIPGIGRTMCFKSHNPNMETQRAGKSAGRGHGRLWKIVPAMGTILLLGCSLPPSNGWIAPAPTDVVAGVEPAPPCVLLDEIELILENMEAVYDGVRDYQSEVETTFFKEDGSVKTTKSLYTFKKPNRIRIEFLSPHRGMILAYPDRNGKVLVKPRGLLSLLTFHLAVDDPLLETPFGQQIDQTDMGLLVKNIRHSVTDRRQGPISLSVDESAIRIEVLADDHFREGVATRYEFVISKEIWLPVEVGKFTAEGVQEGRIVFRNLRTNIHVPDSLFP